MNSSHSYEIPKKFSYKKEPFLKENTYASTLFTNYNIPSEMRLAQIACTITLDAVAQRLVETVKLYNSNRMNKKEVGYIHTLVSQFNYLTLLSFFQECNAETDLPDTLPYPPLRLSPNHPLLESLLSVLQIIKNTYLDDPQGRLSWSFDYSFSDVARFETSTIFSSFKFHPLSPPSIATDGVICPIVRSALLRYPYPLDLDSNLSLREASLRLENMAEACFPNTNSSETSLNKRLMADLQMYYSGASVVDLVGESTDTTHKVAWLSVLVDCHPLTLPFCRAVCHWAERRGLVGTQIRMLSSWAWVLMAVQYLQLKNLLPAIQPSSPACPLFKTHSAHLTETGVIQNQAALSQQLQGVWASRNSTTTHKTKSVLPATSVSRSIRLGRETPAFIKQNPYYKHQLALTKKRRTSNAALRKLHLQSQLSDLSSFESERGILYDLGGLQVGFGEIERFNQLVDTNEQFSLAQLPVTSQTSLPNVSLGDLLLGFFSFYAFSFNPFLFSLSPRRGHLLWVEESLQHHHLVHPTLIPNGLFIEEPFSPSTNAAASLHYASSLFLELKRAATTLMTRNWPTINKPIRSALSELDLFFCAGPSQPGFTSEDFKTVIGNLYVPSTPLSLPPTSSENAPRVVPSKPKTKSVKLTEVEMEKLLAEKEARRFARKQIKNKKQRERKEERRIELEQRRLAYEERKTLRDKRKAELLHLQTDQQVILNEAKIAEIVNEMAALANQELQDEQEQEIFRFNQSDSDSEGEGEEFDAFKILPPLPFASSTINMHIDSDLDSDEDLEDSYDYQFDHLKTNNDSTGKSVAVAGLGTIVSPRGARVWGLNVSDSEEDDEDVRFHINLSSNLSPPPKIGGFNRRRSMNPKAMLDLQNQFNNLTFSDSDLSDDDEVHLKIF